jgi:hypothetical protein
LILTLQNHKTLVPQGFRSNPMDLAHDA